MRHNERLAKAFLAQKVSGGAPQAFWGDDYTYTISGMLGFLGLATRMIDEIGETVNTQIRAKLIEFIVANYLFGDTANVPRDDDSLVTSDIIDSTGILELIEFLESHFEVQVSESEMIPENLGSISNLTEFVMSKQTVRESTC